MKRAAALCACSSAVLLVCLFAAGADFRMPAESVGNREVTSSDGQQIAPEKLWHIYRATERFGLKIADTPTTQEVVLFQADKAGNFDFVAAALNDSGTATSCTVDIKKNGVSMLSSAITIVHGTGDRVPVSGSFSNANYAVGDVISASFTATSTTGAQGPMLSYVRREKGA